MDKKILQKYFRNQCTLEEIEQVMNWFQTEEGQRFFNESLDRDMELYAENKRLLLYSEIPSGKMLENINQVRKKNSSRRKHSSLWLRVAVVLVISFASIAASFWFMGEDYSAEQQEQEVVFRTISTQDDQHRLITLEDGSRIRLNSNSSIELPERFSANERYVRLHGEAYFEIEQDELRPFLIEADQALIRVLGTEFNVRMDYLSGNVQVAVAGGKVSLSKLSGSSERGAILTENTFAMFNLDDEEILIEHSRIENYLSWMSGRLQFYNEPLWVVSRYLDRIYGVSFQFEEEGLKNFTLSVDLAREDLDTVLGIIAETVGAGYTFEIDSSDINKETVLWTHDR